MAFRYSEPDVEEKNRREQEDYWEHRDFYLRLRKLWKINKLTDYETIQLAVCYIKGRGTRKNEKKGVELLKIAEKRFKIKHKKYSDMSCVGDLLSTNDGRTFFWLNELLAECYYYGRGVGENTIKAEKYAIKIYRFLFDKLMYKGFGDLYYWGRDGMKKNYQKAFWWYEKAFQYFHSECYNGLGRCYYYGRGVRKDYKQAVRFFIEGLDDEEDQEDCQRYLAECYLYGKGVKKDIVWARFFLNLCNWQNEDDLKELEKKITAEENKGEK